MHTFPPFNKCYGLLFFSFLFLVACINQHPNELLPDRYQQQGAFIQSLPYYNPDSCVMLIKRDVPPQWQGAAYENLFLDGPEDSPLELGFQHLDYYEKHFPADSATAFAQSWRGRLLVYLNEIDSAMVCLQESYDISNRIGDYLQANEIKSNKGGIYLRMNNFPKAIRAFLESYQTVSKLDSTYYKLKHTALVNLANAYYSSTNVSEALVWARRSMLMATEHNNPTLQITSCQILSAIYRAIELPDSAVIVSKKALELHEKYQTKNSKYGIFKSLSTAYSAKGECQSALTYLNQAISYAHIDPSKEVSIMINLADNYLCLEQLDSAKYYYERLLEAPGYHDQHQAFLFLSKVYAKKGNYKLAYDAIVEGRGLERNRYTTEQMQKVGAAKAELELQLEESLAKEQAQRHEIEQQNTLRALLLAIIVLGILSMLIYRQRTRRRILVQEKELVESREVFHLQELEDKALRLKNTKAELTNTKKALEESAELLAVKNQFVEELKMQIAAVEHAVPETNGNGFHQTISLHDLRILTKNDWQQFRQKFEQIFPAYFGKLKQRYPKLSPADTRLFLLIKSGFNTAEIADTLGIAQVSVWKSRVRLAKKLDLKSTTLLDEFIHEF